ncbi:hypothetical protein F5X99DRAFT_403462 [Biscogniauxia marginata]|nr:hypothetical protein F5X99DRAFT_403462 [Biscogniauxia marginata]
MTPLCVLPLYPYFFFFFFFLFLSSISPQIERGMSVTTEPVSYRHTNLAFPRSWLSATSSYPAPFCQRTTVSVGLGLHTLFSHAAPGMPDDQQSRLPGMCCYSPGTRCREGPRTAVKGRNPTTTAPSQNPINPSIHRLSVPTH